MDSRVIVVKAALDPEAGVWFVEHSDLHGLNAEAPSLDELLHKLPPIIEDLLADEPESAGGLDLSVELIAHASTRVRTGMAA